MILKKHCYGCGHGIALPSTEEGLPSAEEWVMFCPECFSVNVLRWNLDPRPLHETDRMLLGKKTLLVMAWIAADDQLRWISELEEIA